MTPAEAMTAHLTALFPEPPSATRVIEVRVIDVPTDGGRQTVHQRWALTVEAAVEHALEFATNPIAGRSIYVGVSARDKMRGRREDVPCYTAFAADWDRKSRFDDARVADVLERFRAAGLPPSFVVGTGGGYHAYWLLDAPVQARDGEAVARRLCVASGGDAVWEPNRVLRLAGTLNAKHGRAPSWCHLLAPFQPDLRYPLVTVVAALDAMGAPVVETVVDHRLEPDPSLNAADWWPMLRERLSLWTLTLIDSGEQRHASRSETDMRVVGDLVRAGASDEQIAWIYFYCAIGRLKYAEAGAGYLRRTIEAARRSAGPVQTPVPATPNGDGGTTYAVGGRTMVWPSEFSMRANPPEPAHVRPVGYWRKLWEEQ